MKVDEEEVGKYLPGIMKKLEWLSGEDLLKRVLSLESNRLIEYYKDAPVLDIVSESRSEDRRNGNRSERDRRDRSIEEKDRRTADKGYERVFINVGKADGFFAQNLIEMLNNNIRGSRVDLGRIDLLQGYSLFDVRKGDAAKVVSALKNVDFFGKRVYTELADAEKDYASENRGRSSNRSSRGEGDRKRAAGSGGFDRRRTSRRDDASGYKSRDSRDKKSFGEKRSKPAHGNYDSFPKKKEKK